MLILLGELLSGKDLDLTVRWVLGLIGTCLAIWPIYKLGQALFRTWQALFGRFVTLEAFRERTDRIEQRIRALEEHRAQVEEERMEKMSRRLERYETMHNQALEERIIELLEKRRKRE